MIVSKHLCVGREKEPSIWSPANREETPLRRQRKADGEDEANHALQKHLCVGREKAEALHQHLRHIETPLRRQRKGEIAGRENAGQRNTSA